MLLLSSARHLHGLEENKSSKVIPQPLKEGTAREKPLINTITLVFIPIIWLSAERVTRVNERCPQTKSPRKAAKRKGENS